MKCCFTDEKCGCLNKMNIVKTLQLVALGLFTIFFVQNFLVMAHNFTVPNLNAGIVLNIMFVFIVQMIGALYQPAMLLGLAEIAKRLGKCEQK